MMHKNPPRYVRVWAAVFAAFLMWPQSAWAEPYASVESISAPDARGQWVEVDSSAAGARIRGDVRTPLSVGMELEVGDKVETAQVRVHLGLPSGETLTVSEGSDLTLGERSVIQRLGEVYYQVRDVFRVDYGTVQTAVEGTEFTISGRDGPVRVAVTEGVVRVTSAGESVRVARGQVVSVAQSAAPGAPATLKGPALREALSKGWTLGRPKLQLGVMTGGGIVGTDAQMETRIFAGIPVLPGVKFVAESGLGGLISDNTRMSVNTGLEMSVGAVSVGGTGQITLEDRSLDCGGKQVLLHLGGAAHARVQVPLSRRLFVVGGAKAGASGGDFEATGSVGMGVNL